MADNKEKKNGINDPDFLIPEKPRTRICPHCKEEIDTKGDVCPHCKHYLYENDARYQPISKATARKIRWIFGAVLLVVFAGLVFWGVFKLDSCTFLGT